MDPPPLVSSALGFGKGGEKFLCLLQTVGEKGREIVTLPNSS
jgi:hypothetical protein